MLKIIKNPDVKKYEEVLAAIKANENFCPCRLEKTDDTKCMCKAFREQTEPGECCCGAYLKVSSN